MSLADAARTVNDVAYGYISSWALLTAADHRLFDRLPATLDDLGDTYPDLDLVETWLHVLAVDGIVVERDGTWQMDDDMTRLLQGDRSYADYLGGQILQQMTPRLTLGTTGENVLGSVLRDPSQRTGYAGWFVDGDEARAYQASQYAGSLGPAKSLAEALPAPAGRVLDLGGGWGAMARAIARRHDVPVDVVDFESVTSTAPPLDDDRIAFRTGNALERSTWPTDTGSYEGVVLSYLFSSVPGAAHRQLLADAAARDVRWIAVHDFVLDAGAHAAAWSLQHAVFVPGHVSRTSDDIATMLGDLGYRTEVRRPLVDEMTMLVVGVRD